VTRRTFLGALSSAAAVSANGGPVRIARLPEGALQPDAIVDATGVVHLTYLTGDPGKSDVYYSAGASATRLSQGIRVNSIPGSAIASGTIRGAQLALGVGKRPLVAWNGNGQAQPPAPIPPSSDPAAAKYRSPMLYAGLDASGRGFEPQRNLMTRSYTLDGGGAIAADSTGNVYVGWHAHLGEGPQGEEGRRVWVARSTDGGATFAAEDAVFGKPEGACACCGVRFFVASDGTVYGMYRSAFQTVHRDLYLLRSGDHGKTFTGSKLDAWEIGACPMSSMHFTEREGRVWAAWETAGQVRFARVDKQAPPAGAPGEAGSRKHPRLAVDGSGRLLLAWTSVPGWGKPGTLGWALYGASGEPEASGGGDVLPPWSFAFPIAQDDGFTILI
jgi:hypothetical protein